MWCHLEPQIGNPIVMLCNVMCQLIQRRMRNASFQGRIYKYTMSNGKMNDNNGRLKTKTRLTMMKSQLVPRPTKFTKYYTQ